MPAFLSCPVWGAWIEICPPAENFEGFSSRAPYGARGLKSLEHDAAQPLSLSRPVWSAWIEMGSRYAKGACPGSRPVWGAWIEIMSASGGCGRASRAPYGARGLKLRLISRIVLSAMSRPVWGAWIEIPRRREGRTGYHSRAPYGARGLKSRREGRLSPFGGVAPRMGRVD